MPLCLSLHWESGLKHKLTRPSIPWLQSLPSLGEWIETRRIRQFGVVVSRLSLHWESGLKLEHKTNLLRIPGLSLHWESGLKRTLPNTRLTCYSSLPSLGEWIETRSLIDETYKNRGLSLHWESGLKPVGLDAGMGAIKSLPSLGEWIETFRYPSRSTPPTRSLPSLGEWIETSGRDWIPQNLGSLPSLGEWIETPKSTWLLVSSARLSLHWESGLKRHDLNIMHIRLSTSLPSLGEWIETRR